jgi:hypothetical protein
MEKAVAREGSWKSQRQEVPSAFLAGMLGRSDTRKYMETKEIVAVRDLERQGFLQCDPSHPTCFL